MWDEVPGGRIVPQYLRPPSSLTIYRLLLFEANHSSSFQIHTRLPVADGYFIFIKQTQTHTGTMTSLPMKEGGICVCVCVRCILVYLCVLVVGIIQIGIILT